MACLADVFTRAAKHISLYPTFLAYDESSSFLRIIVAMVASFYSGAAITAVSESLIMAIVVSEVFLHHIRARSVCARLIHNDI